MKYLSANNRTYYVFGITILFLIIIEILIHYNHVNIVELIYPKRDSGRGYFVQLFLLANDNFWDTQTLIHANWWKVVLSITGIVGVILLYANYVIFGFSELKDSIEDGCNRLSTMWMNYYYLLLSFLITFFCGDKGLDLLMNHLFFIGLLYIFFASFYKSESLKSSIIQLIAIVFLSSLSFAIGIVTVYLALLGIIILFVRALLSGALIQQISVFSIPSYNSKTTKQQKTTVIDEDGYERTLKENGSGYIDDQGARWKKSEYGEITRDKS